VKPPVRTQCFVEGEAELRQAHLHIKLQPCPHCGRTGTLIGHGFRRGYAEEASEQVIRGRRFFCSNRYRRPGCGRTFSVLLASRLRGFVVSAVTLFHFVEQVALGLARRAAWWVATKGALSVSSGYRLWRRLSGAQSALRTRLCRECPPPASGHHEPLVGLLEHFRKAFPDAACAFSSFQLAAQRGLFD
jgi:hypothetical protein